MTLQAVLWVKIVATVLWAAPLLFFPRSVFRRIGFPEPEPMLFVRLLGAAFLALLVGYARGLGIANGGGYPANTVLVGLVSNGLACAILVLHGLTGAYAGWGRPARVFMWVSAFLTGFVTLGLFVAKR